MYRIIEAGLNPLELILVGTILEISAFVFEVPTGVVADVYSRRLSLIIGTFLIGAGFIVEGLFPIFGAIIVAQVLWGVGFTFRSGAQQAWIADEIGGRVGQIFVRGSQVARIGGLVGTAVGVGLASGYLGLPVPDLAAPLVLGGAVYIGLGLFMIVSMPEEGFRPAARREVRSWTTMGQTFGAGVRTVRRSPTLLAILAIGLFYGASSEPIDRFWELHLLTLTDFSLPALPFVDPVAWWGIISVVSSVLGIAALEVVRRTLNVDDTRVPVRLLSALNLCAITGVFVMAVAGSFALAVAAFLVYRLARGVGGPIGDAWTNQQLESSARATVFSMQAQVDALGQIASGPAIGVVATATTIRAALVAVAAMLAPPQVIYGLVARRR